MSNMFGGGNSQSLYTPLTDVEQECIHKLIDNDLLIINIVGWGYVESPKTVFGDLRLGLQFRLTFNRPETPMPVSYFDLELKTRSGILLYKERQKTMYNGQPLMVATGLFVDLVWDIAITAIDPKIVRQIIPSVRGLTSRWIDKDTGNLTLQGNSKLTEHELQTLYTLRQGEKANRQDTLQQTIKASKKYKTT